MSRPARPAPDYLVPLDLRFAANFSLVGMQLPGFSSPAIPTAKDAALAIALIAPFTRKRINFKAEAGIEKKDLVLFDDLKRKGSFATIKHDVADLMAMAGFDRQSLLELSYERVSRSAICERGFVYLDHGYEFRDGKLRAAYDGYTLTQAHPCTNWKHKPVMVDTRQIAAFSCRHTPAVFMRAVCWWYHGWHPADSDLIVRVQGESVVAEMPIPALAISLGLDLSERATTGDIGKIFAAIKHDFASRSKLQIEFKWIAGIDGRERTRLRVTVAPLSSIVGKPVRKIQRLRPVPAALTSSFMVDLDPNDFKPVAEPAPPEMRDETEEEYQARMRIAFEEWSAKEEAKDAAEEAAAREAAKTKADAVEAPPTAPVIPETIVAPIAMRRPAPTKVDSPASVVEPAPVVAAEPEYLPLGDPRTREEMAYFFANIQEADPEDDDE